MKRTKCAPIRAPVYVHANPYQKSRITLIAGASYGIKKQSQST